MVYGTTLILKLEIILNVQEFESYTRDVEVLKVKVKDKLRQSTREVKENLEIVNALCRLGLSYHFDVEIDEQLNNIFTALPNLLDDNDYDLYTLALLFRVLRQYGYRMSCDVFKRFKDNDGEFKQSIANDVKGLLSLYEATFLSVHGEDILDEALAFTKQRLKIIAEYQTPHLAEHIKKALWRPLHHTLEKIEVLQFIPFYEKDESRNETLLKLAKLDYNRLQLLYRKELGLLQRWYKDMNHAQNFPFARERLVEAYFWVLGNQHEPCYSFARVIGGKHVQLATVLDDMYDSSNATVEELERFTSAFHRLTIDATDELPNYMKVLYKTFLNLFTETEQDEDEGVRYRTSFLKEEWQDLARAYLIDSKWTKDGTVPPFDEYVRNGLSSGALGVVSAGIFIGMGDIIGTKEYEWMQSKPKILKSIKLFSRLLNDITPHEVEKEVANNCTIGVKSYMKEYSVSQEEAVERIQKMLRNAWKDINEDFMKPTVVSQILLKHHVNHVRLSDFIYNSIYGVDLYTNSSLMKDDIKALFLEPLPL